MGHGQRVKARTLIDIDEIQPAGMVADADFTRAGFTDRAVDDLVGLWPARGLDDDGFYHGGFPYVTGAKP